MAPVEERPDTQVGAMGGAPQPRPDTVVSPPQDAYDVAPVTPPQEAAGELDSRPTIGVRAEEGLLQRSVPAPVTEWKVVTVLCCAPAEAPEGSAPPEPEARYRQMHEIYALARNAVQQYGGTLQPLVGELLMAVFGAPAAQEDHAQRAVLAAMDLQRRLHEAHVDRQPQSGDVSAVRLGLHTGVVAVGGLEDDPATSGAVVGDTVTGAVALQEHATPGTILCSEATAGLVQGLVWVAAAGPVAVAGQGTPVPAYLVRGRRARRRPLGPRERRVWTPFVGRTRELHTLQALLAQVEEGWGQVVGVVGEPGLGKSRLVYEFRRSLHGRPVTYLTASCVSHGTATPYLPILALLRHACGLTEGDAPTTIAAKVRAGLTEVGLALDAGAPYLLHLLGVAAGAEGLAGLSPQAFKARTLDTLVQLARQGAHRRPLVLEIENLHWIDPSSEEVLATLVEQLVGARILLLLTYRPGYRPPWIDKSYATQLALPRLAPPDSRLVVQAIVRTASVSEATMQLILARAEGNPLFLEELAYTVVAQGGSHRAAEVPTTLQTVLASRIDRLPPEAKRLLQLAAVIGKDVAVPLLEAIAGLLTPALQRGLAHLQVAELLYETTRGADRTVTFKHALIREAAYQSLLRSSRQEYHQRIVQVLEARFPETAETQPELLAHHYTAAGLSAQALAYWQRAGERAIQRSANVEAIAHLTRGLEVLKTLPDTPERRHQELHLQTALEVGEELLRLAQRIQDPLLLLQAHRALGGSSFWCGAMVHALAHLEHGMAFYDPAKQRSEAFESGHAAGVACLSHGARMLWALGYPAQALQRNQQALTVAHEVAHPASLAYAHTWAAMLHQLRRERPAVQEQAECAVALASEQGLAQYWAGAVILRGWALADQGQSEPGLAAMHQGMAAWRDTGAELVQPYWLALLAEVYRKGGQPTEGLTALAEALALVDKNGQRYYESELYRLKGDLLLRQSDPDAAQAEAHFHQALDVARRQQAKSWELRAAVSLACLWQQQDKRAHAHELLAPIYGWFSEGFDTADLQRAKALLAELA